MDDSVSDYNVGFNSNHYMLQALVAHGSESNLRYGVVEMINYLVHNPDPRTEVAFDILAQYLGGGIYVPTYHYDEDDPNDLLDEDLDPTARNNMVERIRDQVQQAENDEVMEKFINILNGMPEKNPDTDTEEK